MGGRGEEDTSLWYIFVDLEQPNNPLVRGGTKTYNLFKSTEKEDN